MYMISINKDNRSNGCVGSTYINNHKKPALLRYISSKVLRQGTTHKVLSNPIKGHSVPISTNISTDPKGYIEGVDYSKDIRVISRFYLSNSYRFFVSNVILNFIFCGKNPLPLKKSSGETLTISGSV